MYNGLYVHTDCSLLICNTVCIQVMHKLLAQWGRESATLSTCLSPSDSSQQLVLKSGENGRFQAKPLSCACFQIHPKHSARRGEHSPALQKQNRSIWPGCVSWHVYAGQLLQTARKTFQIYIHQKLFHMFAVFSRKQPEVRNCNWKCIAIFSYI